MSHQTYFTEGIVLGGTNVGEGDRMILLLTHDLGLVRAFARSIREERSKLRFALQQFSHASVSLVRGREMWRITGAEHLSNFYHDASDNRLKRLFLARSASLLRRLLQGESPDPVFFELVRNGYGFVSRAELSREEIEAFEQLFVLRALFRLGYASEGGIAGPLIGETAFTEEMIRGLMPERSAVIRLINEALRETQL